MVMLEGVEGLMGKLKLTGGKARWSEDRWHCGEEVSCARTTGDGKSSSRSPGLAKNSRASPEEDLVPDQSGNLQ